MKSYSVFKKVLNGQNVDTAQYLDTTSFETAVVSVTGYDTPDGTVTVYDVPNVVDEQAKPVLLFTYATPTTTKTYVGPCGGGLKVVLASNTNAGTVDVEVVLK